MKYKWMIGIVLCVVLMALSSFLTAGFVRRHTLSEAEEKFSQYVKYTKDDWRFYVNPEEYDEYINTFHTLKAIAREHENLEIAAQNELNHYGASGQMVSTFSHAYEDLGEEETYQLLRGLETNIYLDDQMVVYSKYRHAGDGLGARFSIVYCDDISKIPQIDDYNLILICWDTIYLCFKNPPSVVYYYITQG